LNIPEHRKAIDKLDAHIVRLLNERTRHVLAIGDIKLAAGDEIYAPHRERAVFERVCEANAGPMTDEQLGRRAHGVGAGNNGRLRASSHAVRVLERLRRRGGQQTLGDVEEIGRIR